MATREEELAGAILSKMKLATFPVEAAIHTKY